MLEEEDCDLRIVELVFKRASLLDRQSVRLPAELVPNPVKDLEEKDKMEENGPNGKMDMSKRTGTESKTKGQDGYAMKQSTTYHLKVTVGELLVTNVSGVT